MYMNRQNKHAMRTATGGRYLPTALFAPNTLPFAPSFAIRNRPRNSLRHSPSVRHMCRKLTRSGRPCKHNAYLYSIYCKRHQVP
jgi:hypothetical protein